MNDRSPLRLSRGCYTIGWICPLPVEMTAAMCMLDETHQSLPQSPTDSNTYVLGSVCGHDVVLACLPEMGTTPAATVAQHMKQSFPDLRCALLVGIGGGIPSRAHDIRLGDVVVGVPGSPYGAVVQWDFGKTVAAGEFVHRGVLQDPPALLLTAVNALRARYNLGQADMMRHLQDGRQRLHPETCHDFEALAPDQDILFEPGYDHEASAQSDCRHCDTKRLVQRHDRKPGPAVHFGTIASGNQVIKYGLTRDAIGARFDALCLEMEAAGVVKDLPCIVIRGVCDYSDSHKNKKWQGHAAMTAAAFAKDLLSVVPSSNVNEVLDPGYLFYRDHPPVRIAPMSLERLVRDEQRRWWQGYWHESRVLPPDPPSNAPGRWIDLPHEVPSGRNEPIACRSELSEEREQIRHSRPASLTDKVMETKLADLMDQYGAVLEEQLADFPNPRQRAAVFAAMLKMMNGELSQSGESARTLLHYLAMNGVYEVLPKLVDIGFGVDDSDSDYRTPLHLAVIGNHWKAVQALVQDCHANVHNEDLNGLLPWHLAIHIDWDNIAVNEDRKRSKISIIKFLATRTSEDAVKGADALRILRRLKNNPDTEVQVPDPI